MTEVDAVVPEGVSLPVPTQTDAMENTETNAVASNIEPQKLKDNLNGASKDKKAEPEIMEVDGVDTEEDDSQITSSTENGGNVDGDGGGDDSKISEDVSKQAPLTSDENSSNESTEQDAKAVKTANAVNDDSSNACDGVSPTSDSLNEKTIDDRSDSVASLVKPSLDADESSSSSDQPPNKKPTTAASVSDSDGDGDALSDDESSSNAKLPPNNGDEVSIEPKDMKSNDSSAEPMDCKEDADPLPVDNTVEKTTPKKENGVASSAEKARNDAGIVDLDDDSDEEMEVPKKDDEASNGSESLKAEPKLNATVSKARSVCSDSDGAVIIGSDSENEAVADEPMALISKASLAPKPDLQIIDDDDDDCVVIEDDTPAPMPSDLSKRKSMGPDSDDSQPPNKRQRNGPQSTTLNQITIKDARSLMPQEAAAKRPTESGVNVYPINITPAPSLPQSGPPKLVPVGGAASTLPPTGLPGMSSHANLLPGLTDDMFVLEAPSFIVPYIYEKPPADILKDVLNDIENKYKLTTEDLAEAVKSDEFDMMTEQNKQGKKKKKRRGADDPDESWSEESDEEEDDDDDDSEGGELKTKVLIKEASDELTNFKGAIKPAAAVVESAAADPVATSTVAKPGQENYFESPLGKFFMDIGVGLVQEFVQSDLIRLQKRKMRKSLGKNITDFERAINALAGNLEASKKKNSPFKFTMKRCEFCNFKSESALSMANHYETPHMNGQLYKCNFCIFEIRNATEIVYHMEAVHNIKARLIKPLPYHQCPNCGFEDNGKAKLGRHQPVCAKKFRPELNLAPPNDWEAPAKIPRIKPRHGLVGTATAYQAMAAQAAAQKAALASIQLQQQQVAHARSLQAAALAAQNAANKIRARQTPAIKPGPNSGAALRGPNQVRSPMATNVVLPNNYQLAGGQLIQAANALAKKTLSGQPSISITPLPRQSAASAQATSPSTSKMPPTGMKPGQSPSGRKAEFVICEICDGYIKDLEQLRNHMQWMHKVKIHPKMIYNRPPLNCQKCQFRFFTDQGLERHLLGSHGLVTSSMQEAANKGKDAGRCPVCGRMYQWKLLNHVSRDHHMTLKPAHLSYKCTVCTATFGMYKQFETHVYTAHSTVAKKAMDGKKSNAAPAGASSSQRSGLSASNDSLLKPLKINDEITIIPQPASKPRITNMESHVID